MIWETDWAAALAGGVNFGGKGTLLGGAIGMLMITIINNGLIQIKVSEYWVDAITAAISCPPFFSLWHSGH